MSVLPKIAWRNLWRSTRRTWLTIASMTLGLALTVVMRGMQEGTYAHSTDHMIHLLSGDLQIHRNGFTDDKNLRYAFAVDDALRELLAELPQVAGWAPRVVADGLVSTEEATKGIRLLGIDPQKESSVTTLKNRVIEGDWLETVSEGAVLGKGLKEALDARIGDSLVVMVQGRYGGLTGALIPVVGILRTGWPEIDRTTLFVRLEQAQTMLNLDDAILEIALRTTDLRKVPAVVIWLNQNLSSRWETHTWSELLPEIEQMIRFDRVGGQIFIAILLLVVLFGALNTVLMSVVERARELRMMLAVGMTPGSLGRMVAIETGIMLLIGMVLGHIIAAPINLYLAANPIYFTGETAAMIEEIGWEPMVTSQYTWLLVGSSTLMMAAIGLVVVLWPLKRIYQIRTIKERE